MEQVWQIESERATAKQRQTIYQLLSDKDAVHFSVQSSSKEEADWLIRFFHKNPLIVVEDVIEVEAGKK